MAANPRLSATPAPAAATAASRAFSSFWQRLGPRERWAVALAGAVIAAGLLWGLLLAPALATLRRAEQERAALAAQTQQMQQLSRQAEALKALPRINAADALRALQTTTAQRLGDAAKITAQGDRASVTLTRVSASQLAGWLADARANARATVQEMRLTHDAPSGNTATGNAAGNMSGDAPENPPGNASANTAATASPLWSGTLTLALPPS